MSEELRNPEDLTPTSQPTTVPGAIGRERPIEAEDWIANRDIDEFWPAGNTLAQAEAVLQAERRRGKPEDERSRGHSDRKPNIIRIPKEKADSTTVDNLCGWLRKEDHLVAEVCKHSKGEPNQISAPEYEAAVQAARVGRVLSAAEHSPKIRVPHAFGDLGKDIERLASRLHGFGLGKSTATDSLRQISAAQMRCLVDNARKLGLLDEGQGWATKPTAARCIAREIGHVVEKSQFLDRGAPR